MLRAISRWWWPPIRRGFCTELSSIWVPNAIKYNRPRGRVDNIALREAPHGVILSVVDTGVGIPAQFKDQVFEPFNRLYKDTSGISGTGIGLALSKRLAQASASADLTFGKRRG